MFRTLPAITFSVLSATAFAAAIVLGFKLADVRNPRVRHSSEARAAIVAGIGAVMLILAILFWIQYIIFGPLRDFVVEVISAGGD